MQLEVKSITVKEARKIKLGTWVRYWAGENKEKVTSVTDAIVVKNRQKSKWLDVLNPISGEVEVIDYDQVLQVGNLVSVKDTGLVY